MPRRTAATVLSRRLREAGVCNPGHPSAFGRRQGVYVVNSGPGAARVRIDFDGEAETVAILDEITEAVTAWGYTVVSRSESGMTVAVP